MHSKRKVLFIDDERYDSQQYVHSLNHHFDIDTAETTDEAIELSLNNNYNLIVVDVMMPPGKKFSQIETHGGYKTGVALSRELAEQQPEACIIALTSSRDPEVEIWFTRDERHRYCHRSDYTPHQFTAYCQAFLRGQEDSPNIFIVHGHDQEELLSLKNYLQNTLGLDQPTILSEQESGGRTVIEKFEEYAEDIDLVFILLTPDDVIQNDKDTIMQARPNVLFELGFFTGKLGRRSGKVIVLRKGKTAIPSDLSGVIYIDISDGIESSGESIRRELRHWI